jgi:hypothetical protein
LDHRLSAGFCEMNCLYFKFPRKCTLCLLHGLYPFCGSPLSQVYLPHFSGSRPRSVGSYELRVALSLPTMLPCDKPLPCSLVPFHRLLAWAFPLTVPASVFALVLEELMCSSGVTLSGSRSTLLTQV